MDSLLQDFLEETAENLNSLDNDLVLLEKDPQNKNVLSRIFRAVHTIKGSSGFLNLGRLEELTHHTEHILGLFRNGERAVTPDYITLILESLDRVRHITKELETSGAEPDGNDSALINRMARIINSGDIERLTGSQENTITNENNIPVTPSENAPSAKTIRIAVDTLEKLMTITGELVLTRNRLLQAGKHQEAQTGNTALLQHLNQLVFELQENILSTRMQPLGTIWDTFPRMVRDLGIALGKTVNLEIKGQDTELDRQILELIKAPMTHMIRNCIDHGIEKPAERIKVCKKETGLIRLNARHESGHVIITVEDDGKGLCPVEIKKTALALGLVPEKTMAKMSPEDIFEFIFMPGFSTSPETTAISGRGVGMDIVRKNIEDLGGTIAVNAVTGKNTCFTIKIPVTLSIISALVVGSSGHHFAIPQNAVAEILMLSDDKTGDQYINIVNGAAILHLRGQLIPVIDLWAFLHADTKRQNYKNKLIIVVNLENRLFGIAVDTVTDTEEIVIKPLAPVLKDIKAFWGCSVLGDGRLALIIDPSFIARHVHPLDHDTIKQKTGTSREEKREGDKSYLLFEAGKGAPKALDLSSVIRLKALKSSDIEWPDNNMAFQENGNIIPLILYDDCPLPTEGTKKLVIITEHKNHYKGLLIDRIIDIHTVHNLTIQTGGHAVINGKATDIINPSCLMEDNP